MVTKEIDMEFKVGDIVHLKSGSGPLEIIHISRNGKCLCDWNDRNGTLQEVSFWPSMLSRTNNPEWQAMYDEELIG